MGSVDRRVQAGKVSWLARWRDPDGHQRKKSFARRVDAGRFLATISADVVRRFRRSEVWGGRAGL